VQYIAQFFYFEYVTNFLEFKQSPTVSTRFDYDHLGWNIPYCAICTEFFIAYVFCGLPLCCRGAYLAEDLGAGSTIGLVIAAGYGTQTIGLQTIPSSESAFLTALYVPLVPILMWLIFRKVPHIMTWVGAVLAFAGLILLTGNGFEQISLNFGQLVTVLGSLAIALEIIFISYFAGKVNLRRVTVIQLGVASLVSFAIMPAVGEHAIPAFSWPLVLLAVALGLASALIQFVMNWAQRMVDPSRAAIIYAGEPVWAGIIGRIAGERLPVIALLGGALVVLGVLVSELKLKLPIKKTKRIRE